MVIRDRKQRLEFLDALRGLAAAYVVIYHMILIPHPSLTLPRWARTLASGGYTGVTLFFMVSAFSLYFTMPLRLRESHPTRAFYLHRFFRIAPLFYVLLIATLIRDIALFDVTHSKFDIASSLLFLFNLVPGREQGIVWAGWTVGVEVLFYAVFPLIYRHVRSAADAITFGVVAVLAWNLIQSTLTYLAVTGDGDGIHRPMECLSAPADICRRHLDVPHLHLDGLGQNRSGPVRRYRKRAPCIRDFVLFRFARGLAAERLRRSLLLAGDRVRRHVPRSGLSPWKLVVNRATRYLGKISYSLYLNHPTVALLLTPAYRWLYGHTPYATVSLLASVV